MLTGGGSCKQGADNHTANAILFGYQNNIHDILFYQYLLCGEEERRVSEDKKIQKKSSETKRVDRCGGKDRKVKWVKDCGANRKVANLR